MSLLKEFEKKLESLVEGVFAKGFRSAVQPVELAKRLEREMDEGKTVSVSRVYVPNRFLIALSAEDKKALASFEPQLILELKDFLKKHAREKGYSFLTDPEITFEEKADLSLGEFSVLGELASPEKASIQAALTLTIKGEEEETFFISKPVTTIGRIESNDLVIPDPSISRHHAKVERRDGQFYLVDLDSTNGTFLAGRPVKEALLRDGARIGIGKIVLEFRRL